MALQVEELLALPEDWNSYGAGRIDPDAARLALDQLVAYRYCGPLPHVAPTARGGVQFEWNWGDEGVEIEVNPGRSVEILFDIGGEMEDIETEPYHHQVLRALAWAAGQH
jgi:hypothetical protein